MPNLGGFEVVGELTVEVLNQILKSSWDNNIIPHSVPIPAGTAFGPYQLASGVVNIHRDTLNLVMDTGVNGVRITLPAEIQVEVANPPVPSAHLFNMTANIVASVPIGVVPGTIHVAALLNAVTRPNVSASLTSGDPVPPLTLAMIGEYVHARYTDNTIPHTTTQTGIPLGVWSGNAFVEIFDDSSNPAHTIEVSQPTPTTVKVRLPFHLRLSNLSATAGPTPASPFGVTGRIAIIAQFDQAPGSLTVHFSTATVSIEDLAPAAGVEGSNYTLDKTGASLFGLDLDNLLKTNMITRGQAIVTALGDRTFLVPTVAMIETFIADQAHTAITGRGNIDLWTPTPPAGGDVTVSDVKPLALANAIAFCLNNPAGDTSVIIDFIPAGRSCAIAIDGNKVLQIIRDQINKPEADGGFGGLPHTEHNVNGHDAIVTRIDPSLKNGAIRIEGDVTVVDAIAGSIDVDASFSADIGLRWVDGPGGTQKIEPFVIGDPDVDLSVLAWILSFLFGFITLGLVGGIIAIVVMAVAEGVASKVGGVIVRDDVTGQIKGIGAWPQNLEGIGTVTSRFENPVLIDPQSVMFPDAYLVTAKFASTVIAFAEANGPYTVDAGAPITFSGGPPKPDTTYEWDFGDGAAASGMVATHTYADNGIYVAKLSTTVHQPGGVTTRQFAKVIARNVPPVVNAGPDLSIDEGQEVEFSAAFTDQEWPDTHTAIFDFGDDSLPANGTVNETNIQPRAVGKAKAKHAYCDNGEYILTIEVTDDDGGVGTDMCKVTVRNVPPKVDAGDDPFAYPGFPISLEACFTDPGWCDTHTATWEFGDCTPPSPAVVHETNDPPAAVGVAAAIHVYQCCGTYLARCVVTDDDGGSGEDSLHVRVVELQNPNFEGGFRARQAGVVANGWEPYTLGASELAAGADGRTAFEAEEFIVHGGQRSQRIFGLGKFRGGIYQSIGANPGWDYQVSVWYHLEEHGGGKCRLGIDPEGGNNPDGAAVVWSKGGEHRNWAELLVRVTAKARQVTIFLEMDAENQSAAGYFDDVLLIPYPCPPKTCKPEKPKPQERSACVDWKDIREPSKLAAGYQKGGFTFQSMATIPLLTALWGPPPGQGKLQFPDQGVEINLPFEANQAIAQVASGTSQPVKMSAFDAAGKNVGTASTPAGKQGLQVLEIDAPAMIRLIISGGGNEGLLVDLCVYQKPDQPVKKE